MARLNLTYIVDNFNTHGLSHIDQKRGAKFNIPWVVVFLAALTGFAVQAGLLVMKYNDGRTIYETTISMPENGLPLPAITLCDNNPVPMDLLDGTMNMGKMQAAVNYVVQMQRESKGSEPTDVYVQLRKKRSSMVKQKRQTLSEMIQTPLSEMMDYCVIMDDEYSLSYGGSGYKGFAAQVLCFTNFNGTYFVARAECDRLGMRLLSFEDDHSPWSSEHVQDFRSDINQDESRENMSDILLAYKADVGDSKGNFEDENGFLVDEIWWHSGFGFELNTFGSDITNRSDMFTPTPSESCTRLHYPDLTVSSAFYVSPEFHHSNFSVTNGPCDDVYKNIVCMADDPYYGIPAPTTIPPTTTASECILPVLERGYAMVDGEHRTVPEVFVGETVEFYCYNEGLTHLSGAQNATCEPFGMSYPDDQESPRCISIPLEFDIRYFTAADHELFNTLVQDMFQNTSDDFFASLVNSSMLSVITKARDRMQDALHQDYLDDLLSEEQQIESNRVSPLVVSCTLNGQKCSQSTMKYEFVNYQYNMCARVNFGGSAIAERAGVGNGFQIIATIDSEEYLYTSDKVGAVLLLNNQTTYPFPEIYGLNLAPGMAYSVHMRQSKITRTTNCQSSNEDILYGEDKDYTLNGCLNSCAQRTAKAKCDCTLADLPHIKHWAPSWRSGGGGRLQHQRPQIDSRRPYKASSPATKTSPQGGIEPARIGTPWHGRGVAATRPGRLIRMRPYTSTNAARSGSNRACRRNTCWI